MRAFILTVDGRPRNPGLVSGCEAHGVDAEVVTGVLGSTLTHAQLRERYSERGSVFTLDRPLGPGEIGCALGHRQIVEQFAWQTDDRWAIVLEDDAVIERHLAAVVDLLAQLPDAPIILTFVPGRTGPYADQYAPGEAPVRLGDVSATRLSDPPDLNTGYAINRRAALIAARAYRRRRIDSVADWPYRWARNVQFWRLDPPLARPIGADSLIHDDRSALQSAARRRMDPNARKFLLGLLGVRVLQGLTHGYSPGLIWRQDVLPFARRLRGRQ